MDYYNLYHLTKDELLTIKRALIIYNKNLYKGLKNKGFFIDIPTYSIDVCNIDKLMFAINKILEEL